MIEKDANVLVAQAINEAKKLGWISTINDEVYMHVADVEKVILGVLCKPMKRRIKKWIVQKEAWREQLGKIE